MAVVTRYSSGVLDPSVIPPKQVPEGIHNARTKVYTPRVAMVTGDTAASKYVLCRIPSSARLLSISGIHHPAIVGVSFDLGDVNDPNGLMDNISLNAAGSKAIMTPLHSKAALPLWQLLGYAENPDKDLELYLTNKQDIPADVSVVAEIYVATI